MTWTKLSDDFTDDCWTLPDQAYRLHTEGLVWSNRKLLDLRIPKDEVRRFAKHPEAVAELVDGGWWIDEGDHYLIVHHGRYQRDRDAVIKQQTVNKENRAKRGKATPASREVSFSRSNGSSHDSSHEMDRPGQDRHVVGEASEEQKVNLQTGEVDDTPALLGNVWNVTQPGSGGLVVNGKCVGCGWPADGVCTKDHTPMEQERIDNARRLAA